MPPSSWLALNDVRILLEPSEVHIQAIILLACHVEEFSTPALSWMLVSAGCRQLQALGINHRRLDPATRERRKMLFWNLNLVEKGLSLIFGRPPTFHRAMAKEIPMPTVKDLLPAKPHLGGKDPASSPGTFGAHFFHQVMKVSLVIADIWNCIWEDVAPNDQEIEKVHEELDAWYQEAKTVCGCAIT
jgi:hypothetical protein